jgi:poly(3-hydroxybutyrate) depolymerase
VFAAVSLMEAADDPLAPSSMVLMGGPIDTREHPTAVNTLAMERGLEWFERHCVMTVPWPMPGFLRQVYPGFLQLGGFMGMNLDRHILAHREFYDHLVQGDGDSAAKHREFYDEYLAVMDLTAEFYLQTVEQVFIRHALPKGEFMHRGKRVDPSAIRRTALLTVEGERDDISGVGQTEAAHRLAVNLPDDKRYHYLQEGVGHYGVFNGSRFRSEIAPRISDFVWTHDRRPRRGAAAKPAVDKPAAAEAVVAVAEPRSPEPQAAPRAAAPKAANGKAGNGATHTSPRLAEVAEAATAAPARRTKPAPEASAPAKSAPARAAAKTRRVKAAKLSEIVLPKPRGKPDDLTRIRGIGPKLAETLHTLGIFHFSQLSALGAKAAEELDAKLSFRGRIRRDGWITQAKALAGDA